MTTALPSSYCPAQISSPAIFQIDRPLSDLCPRYESVRRFSETLAAPLSAEDCAIQSMPDASPTRWHLAHTTWFFETFLLKGTPGYEVFHPHFEVLFNSYYNSVGEQFPRARRGLISRPGLAETMQYRQHVDAAVRQYLSTASLTQRELSVMETGLQHEQQHQELILTDIKHALSMNPLFPVYREAATASQSPAPSESADSSDWVNLSGDLVEVGFDGDAFCFDNEQPAHRVFLNPFQLASRTVTNADYLNFMEDGGYRRPEFWLSAGWATVQQRGWDSPGYWHNDNGVWKVFTLSGLQEPRSDAPVCHVSYFEADAYARWAGYRLPAELEWEHGVRTQSSADATGIAGHWSTSLMEDERACHPQPDTADDVQGLHNAYGNVWEWTSSQYTAYPGYRPVAGALGEYNGKFMCNQFVLRGGSCATPAGHIRPTYRNFFPPDARWQFSGIRLAADASR